MNPILQDGILKTAKKHKIAVQITGNPRGTGTDANAMQLSRGGVATTLVSVPNRYMHTPVEVISKSDLDNIIKLIVEFIVAHPATKNYKL